MKTSRRLLPLTWIAALSLSASAGAQVPKSVSPTLQIKDIPVQTQRGEGKGRYVPPVPTKADLPTLWLIGDSTVRNGSGGDNGPEGQWGWGGPIAAFIDLTRVNLVNRALGGTSSRSFYNANWKEMKPSIKKGDFVMIQFGHNDGGRPEGVYPQGRGSLNGSGEETREVETTPGTKEVVHTFGWYLKQYVDEAKAQGATSVICSFTAREAWNPDGTFKSGGSYATWAAEVAKNTNTLYLPLNETISARYQVLGKAKVETFFVPAPKESLHTGWDGAVVNAECVIAGLKALPGDPLGKFLNDRARPIAPWTAKPADVLPAR
ncbi:rhamnogalacturonan acetylesterase [Luteolibacter sp. LG18]|uniref:rhamnogalacturonan acetylesterase n=1 Tax=Luteolibacter sp. LG18 TaxID=2819286 RepID=UPI002B2F8EDB|nr:hypothetical protein llg_35600 [Luteolibacter sp. LG18]